MTPTDMPRLRLPLEKPDPFKPPELQSEPPNLQLPPGIDPTPKLPPFSEENPFLKEILKTPEQRAKEKLAEYFKQQYGISPEEKPSFWKRLNAVAGEISRAFGAMYSGQPYLSPWERATQEALQEYRVIAPVMAREQATEALRERALLAEQGKAAALDSLSRYRDALLELRQQQLEEQKLKREQDAQFRAEMLRLKQILLDPQMDLMKARTEILRQQSQFAGRNPIEMAQAMSMDEEGNIDFGEFLTNLQRIYNIVKSEKAPPLSVRFDTQTTYDPESGKIQETPTVTTYNRATGQAQQVPVGAPPSSSAVRVTPNQAKRIEDFASSASQSAIGVQAIANTISQGKAETTFGPAYANSLILGLRRYFGIPDNYSFQNAMHTISKTNASILHARGLTGAGRPAQRLIEQMETTVGGSVAFQPHTLLANLTANYFLAELSKHELAGTIPVADIRNQKFMDYAIRKYVAYIDALMLAQKQAAAMRQANPNAPVRVPVPNLPDFYQLWKEWKQQAQGAGRKEEIRRILFGK